MFLFVLLYNNQQQSKTRRVTKLLKKSDKSSAVTGDGF